MCLSAHIGYNGNKNKEKNIPGRYWRPEGTKACLKTLGTIVKKCRKIEIIKSEEDLEIIETTRIEIDKNMTLRKKI